MVQQMLDPAARKISQPAPSSNFQGTPKPAHDKDRAGNHKWEHHRACCDACDPKAEAVWREPDHTQIAHTR